MERALLPSAFFPDFTKKNEEKKENRSRRPEDELCKLFFFHGNVEGKARKKRTTRAVSWRPLALAYSCD